MKKLIRIAITFMMALSVVACLLPATVKAAEATDGMVSVYVKTPDSWEGPCAWAWNEDGTNAFEAWPGEGFEKDTANAGWSYIWLPSYANHVIVNASEASVQTEEIILEEGKNAWITISEDASYEVSYDALTKGETPAYVAKFATHVTAGSDMEVTLTALNDDESESYTAQVSITANEYTTVKIPTWTTYVTFSSAEVNGEKIKVDPVELWMTVGDDLNAELSYVDPAKASVPNVTVNVKVPSDWEGPCLWAWSAPDGTNVFSSWPGESFVNEADGWLQLEIPGWVNSIIINANEGSVQTADMSIETEKDVWVVITSAEEYEVYYEKPEAEETTVAEAETAGAVEEEASSVAPIVICAIVVILAVVIIAFVARNKKTSK